MAELTASMLWTAPILALLAIPAALVLGIDPYQSPQKLAYLYGMALLGTWSTLIPNKVLENRRIDKTNQRLMGLGVGLLLGAAGTAMVHLLQLGLTVQHDFFNDPGNLQPVYFGFLTALTAGWSQQTVRDRIARFRLMPILWTVLVSALLMPFWPYKLPYGMIIAVMIATGVQLVSPWNEAASLYARYVRASGNLKGKVRQA
jgi:hypothetical protein